MSAVSLESRPYDCPIIGKQIEDPVITFHGHTFERGALVARIKDTPACLICGIQISAQELIPNQALATAIKLLP